MHLVLLHGYLLQGTGSNIYVANIAKAWQKQGHAVTVVCQELQAAKLPFVNEFIGLGEKLPSAPPKAGQMRVVVPNIQKLLPVYVFDRYDGFEVKTIPQMTVAEINTHITLTANCLREVAQQGVQQVLANHALFGPIIAKTALQNLEVPFDVKIHGSAIEYTLVPNPRFMPYAVEGLAAARNIFVGTRHVRERVLEVFSGEHKTLKLESKLKIVSPGMDPDIFKLSTDFQSSFGQFKKLVRARIQKNDRGRRSQAVPKYNGQPLDEYHQELVKLGETYDQRATDADLLERFPALKENEPIILYFGKFLNTKGAGEFLATVPTILKQIPQARCLFVGFGSYREHLEGMLQALKENDKSTFIGCAQAGDFVEAIDFDKWFRHISPAEAERITITGILDHEMLSELLPLVSVSIVPSKWSEPFGMVAVEAMAAGVLPLCNYHAGLKDVVDEVDVVNPGLAELIRVRRDNFTDQLPDKIKTALAYLYPKGFDHQEKRREIARQLRQISVDNFSWDGIARKLIG